MNRLVTAARLKGSAKQKRSSAFLVRVATSNIRGGEYGETLFEDAFHVEAHFPR